MNLEHFDPLVHADRRARLGELLGGTSALLPAGLPASRNYAANTYPFRASSHFLYLVGIPIPGAMALLDGERCTVFLPKAERDDALWHGPSPSPDELARRLGCAVRPMRVLADALGARTIATLPAVDHETRQRQVALLGRDITLAAMTEDDERLADAIILLRTVHDEAAQAGLRRAGEATTAAHVAGMGVTRPGIREWRVRAAMESELIARGMSTAYHSIVSTRGEILHNPHHHHTLLAGDLLLADVGAETHDGWAADVTRTWPVSGTFSPTQAAIYDVVLAAQKAAIAAVGPGARYRYVHDTACLTLTRGLVELGILRGDPEELVGDGVHALFFPHGVGHLLGLDVHDLEDLGDRAGYAPGRERASQFGTNYLRLDRDLQPDMAVTIEPGFYQVPVILRDEERTAFARSRVDWDELARFRDVRGIRVEDDVLVTPTGREVLTAAIPKERAAVEATVGREA